MYKELLAYISLYLVINLTYRRYYMTLHDTMTMLHFTRHDMLCSPAGWCWLATARATQLTASPPASAGSSTGEVAGGGITYLRFNK